MSNLVIIDEAANFKWPKWYRNPRMWWTFRKMAKSFRPMIVNRPTNHNGGETS